MSTATPPVSSKLFGLFCLASYLLSLSYGSTFLLSLLIGSRGGNEQDAGSVISAAMLSTFAAVIVSGHLSDWLGAARSVALFGPLLVAASLGFALTPGFGHLLLIFGLLLGLGWGVFYTLGPIIVASLVTPAQRAKYFALLSGSMMTGIGSGPLLGRAASALGYPVTAAFYLAALASLVGYCCLASGPTPENGRGAIDRRIADFLARRGPGAVVQSGVPDHHGRPRWLRVRRIVELSNQLRGAALARLFVVLSRLHERGDQRPPAGRRIRGQARSTACVLPAFGADAGLDPDVRVRGRQRLQLRARRRDARGRLRPDLFSDQRPGRQ
jgi:MFS family permease